MVAATNKKTSRFSVPDRPMSIDQLADWLGVSRRFMPQDVADWLEAKRSARPQKENGSPAKNRTSAIKSLQQDSRCVTDGETVQ